MIRSTTQKADSWTATPTHGALTPASGSYIASALVLSAFTAVTAVLSMALVSRSVPNGACCANVSAESVMAASIPRKSLALGARRERLRAMH
jgi:hypothetical protein